MKNHLENVRRFHDLESSCYTNKRYNERNCEGLSYVTRKAILLGLIERMPQGRILDVGCGPGILTSELINSGRSVYSIDLSMAMLRRAQGSIRRDPHWGNAQFSNCEVSQICFQEGSFASVLCIGVIYYVEDYIAVMREIYRVLAQGGTAVVQIDKVTSPLLYMILIPVYRWLKNRLRGKQYEEIKFGSNIFSYKRFLKDVKRVGYSVGKIEYYDFRVPFLDVIVPNVSVRLGRWLFVHRKMRIFRPFSYGMLVCLNKE